MGKYDNIINEQWPKKSDRIRMAMEERAKIFLPFAALKGHDEAIEGRNAQEILEDTIDTGEEYGTWE